MIFLVFKKVKFVLVINFIFGISILSCQVQVYSNGVGTYNQMKHKSCIEKFGKCEGKLFLVDCKNLNDIISDVNNGFEIENEKENMSKLSSVNCEAKSIYLFEGNVLEEKDELTFKLNESLPLNQFEIEYEYIKFTRYGTNKSETYPKRPESDYSFWMKPSSITREIKEFTRIRYLLEFEKINSIDVNELKVSLNKKTIYEYDLNKNE